MELGRGRNWWQQCVSYAGEGKLSAPEAAVALSPFWNEAAQADLWDEEQCQDALSKYKQMGYPDSFLKGRQQYQPQYRPQRQYQQQYQAQPRYDLPDLDLAELERLLSEL